MLTRNLANKIVMEMRNLLNEEIIVANPTGIIIASTDQERIGDFHEGALHTCTKKTLTIIASNDTKRWTGVKPGINLPVFFHEEVIGVIGITGDPRTVSPFGEIVKKMTELLIQENYYIEEMNLAARSLEALVFDWLEKEPIDESFKSRAAALGFDLTLPFRIALIHTIASFGTRFPSSFISNWNHLHPSRHLIRWGNDRLLYIMDASAMRLLHDVRDDLLSLKSMLESELQCSVAIGVGSSIDAVKIRISYQQAERALKSAAATEEIIFESDLTIEMITQEINKDIQKQYLARTISPLLDNDNLLSTLQAFFHCNMAFNETASYLHIHINTLHYRLRRIEEMTGHSLKTAKGLVALYIALSFLEDSTKLFE
ncbi:CdaR family transcriptional regulator [Falsibacillus albus]|uniref:CdaR family transcriptional regulator n=1 Tax=Falsibacillus albus TaxID=2478915 RepID=UPI001314836A|nr:sugar diacid recognition domain-containing protein [Falsibacillus albus]